MPDNLTEPNGWAQSGHRGGAGHLLALFSHRKRTWTLREPAMAWHGFPCGPAGVDELELAPGVVLRVDIADPRRIVECEVVRADSETVLPSETRDPIEALFGQEVAAIVAGPLPIGDMEVEVSVDSSLAPRREAAADLAHLGAIRDDPPETPSLWAAEAAALALQAGPFESFARSEAELGAVALREVALALQSLDPPNTVPRLVKDRLVAVMTAVVALNGHDEILARLLEDLTESSDDGEEIEPVSLERLELPVSLSEAPMRGGMDAAIAAVECERLGDADQAHRLWAQCAAAQAQAGDLARQAVALACAGRASRATARAPERRAVSYEKQARSCARKHGGWSMAAISLQSHPQPSLSQLLAPIVAKAHSPVATREEARDPHALAEPKRQVDTPGNVGIGGTKEAVSSRHSHGMPPTAGSGCTSTTAATHRRGVFDRKSRTAAVLAFLILATSLVLVSREPAPAIANVNEVDFTATCPNATDGTDQAGANDDHLEVAGVWAGEERRKFRLVLDQFSRERRKRVTFSVGAPDSPDDPDRKIANTLRARIDAGCPPDIALLPQPGLLQELAERKEIKPINDKVVRRLVAQNYTPAWGELGTVNGALYGVWFRASNKSIVWYRTDAFKQAGVDPPKTWAELQQIAERIAASGVSPFSIAGADGWTLTDWFENVYLRTAGPDMYDRLARHEIPWTDPSVTEALTILAEVFGRSEWIAGGTGGALTTKHEHAVLQVFGEPSKAAMVYEGDFVANVITGNTGARVDRDARVFPFPSIGDSERAAVATGGDVAVLFKENESTREMLRFLATPEAAEPWVKAGGFLSPNKKLDPGLYPDLTTLESAKVLIRADNVRFDLSDLQPVSFGGTPEQGMWKILQGFLANPNDVETTARLLETARRASK